MWGKIRGRVTGQIIRGGNSRELFLGIGRGEVGMVSNTWGKGRGGVWDQGWMWLGHSINYTVKGESIVSPFSMVGIKKNYPTISILWVHGGQLYRDINKVFFLWKYLIGRHP